MPGHWALPAGTEDGRGAGKKDSVRGRGQRGRTQAPVEPAGPGRGHWTREVVQGAGCRAGTQLDGDEDAAAVAVCWERERPEGTEGRTEGNELTPESADGP